MDTSLLQDTKYEESKGTSEHLIIDEYNYNRWLKTLFYKIPPEPSMREVIFETKNYIQLIEEIIQSLDNFPVSYNQVFLSGSLSYCENALKKLKTSTSKIPIIYKTIKDYVSSIEAFYKSLDRDSIPYNIEDTSGYKKSPDNILAYLDLQSFEDRFDMIQEKCKNEGILPYLEEITISECVEK